MGKNRWNELTSNEDKIKYAKDYIASYKKRIAEDK